MIVNHHRPTRRLAFPSLEHAPPSLCVTLHLAGRLPSEPPAEAEVALVLPFAAVPSTLRGVSPGRAGALPFVSFTGSRWRVAVPMDASQRFLEGKE